MSSPPPATAAAAEVDPLDCLDTPEMKALLAKRAAAFPTTSIDIERYLEGMPLMTTTLPSTPADTSADLAAIDAIADEEKPEDRVEAFKQSGNDAWKLAQALHTDSIKAEAALQQRKEERQRRRTVGPPLTPEEAAQLERDIERLEDKLQRQQAAHRRKLRDAYEYYTKAVELEVAFLPLLASSVLSNRSLVSLTLHNYGHALSDARLAIKKDRNNAKAWYRGATALLRIGRLALAGEWVEGGLTCRHAGKGEVEALRRLRKEVEEAAAAERAKEARVAAARKERLEAEERGRREEEKEREEVEAALKDRGLTLGPALFAASTPSNASTDDDDSDPSPPSSSPSPSPYRGRVRVLADGSLSFPLLFLYPSSQQSDHIEQHHEMEPLLTSLKLLFPPSAASPPWDARGEWRVGELDVWVECEGGKGKKGGGQEAGVVELGEGLVRVKVDPELSLLSLLTMPALRKRGYRVPGIPTFTVTLKGK